MKNVSPEDLLSRASKLSKNESKLALELIDEAIALSPYSPKAYCARGIVWYQNGDLQNAILNFEKALSLNANYLNALYNLAVVRFDQKQLEMSLRFLNLALDIESQERLLFYRGRVNLELGAMKDAVSDFDRCIEMGMNNRNVHLYRGVARARNNDFEAALLDFEQAATESDDAEVLLWKASSQNFLKQYSAAVVSALKAIELDKSCAEAYYQHALGEYYRQNFKLAIQSFEKSIELDGSFAKEAKINIALARKAIVNALS